MVKIIFEIEEKFVKEQTDVINFLKKKVSARAEDAGYYRNVISFSILQQAIEKGAKEIVVRQSDFANQCKITYDKIIPTVARLGGYVFLRNK